MARDGGGVYSKPSGTTAPFASNLISSTTFNTLIDDFVTDANTARPITAGGTGATSASAARTALGVQALDGDLTAIAALGYTSGAYLFKKTAADTYSLITITSAGEALLDDADASAQRTTLGLVIGTNVAAYDADALLADTGDTLTAGYLSDSYSGGTVSSGTYTPAPATNQENFQHYTNGGAHTLAPPASVCAVVIEILNDGSAGAITTSGFTKVTGDAFTTTNGHKFLAHITKSNSYSHLHVTALQ